MSLQAEAAKVIAYAKSIGLTIPPRAPSHQHVGALIADAVLQVGHRYDTHVRPRVRHILNSYPNADTISGVSSVLKTVSLEDFLDWKGMDEHARFQTSVTFFTNEKVDTFANLREWLESDTNRDRLLSSSGRSDKAGIPKISNATADYYRVLVRLPDAVKVDSLVKEFVRDAGVNAWRYDYQDLRTIVQLAAGQLGKPPIDLEGAIWNYQVEMRKKRRTRMRGNQSIFTANDLSGGNGKKGRRWKNESDKICTDNGLDDELRIIDAMSRPATWNLARKGPGGQPEWWFRRAVYDCFERLWLTRGINDRPQADIPSRKSKGGVVALDEYITEPEGGNWLNKYRPPWVSQPPSSPTSPPPLIMTPARPLSITLSPEDQTRLDNIARRSGISQSALVQALIAWNLP